MIVIGAVRSTVTWLADQRHIQTAHGLLPAENWRSQCERDWQSITGKPVPASKQLAYDQKEADRIRRAISRADPRIVLAYVIGAPQHIGQVRSLWRTDIRKHKGHDIGRITDLGKPGEFVELTQGQRETIEATFDRGFLSVLEANYKAKEIDDYLLIPGGYLAREKAQVKHALTRLSDRAIRTFWRDVEKLAGVEHKPGRGWLGLRRWDAEDAIVEKAGIKRRSVQTGWRLVDRQINKAFERLEEGVTPEDFQAVGVLVREATISLAQAVFDAKRHQLPGEPIPGRSDAKKMVEGYIAKELGGGAHAAQRHYAREVMTLANDLQHARFADYRDAALCVEAATSLINTIAIVSGLRLQRPASHAGSDA